MMDRVWRRRRGAGIFLLAVMFLLSAPAMTLAESVTVSIDNFTFKPDVLTIKPGTAVTFVNHDDIPHSIVDAKGNRIARLGGENGPGLEAGKFLAPHGIAMDSKGDIYVGEVGVTDWKTSFPDTEMPAQVRVKRCLQKLEKV